MVFTRVAHKPAGPASLLYPQVDPNDLVDLLGEWRDLDEYSVYVNSSCLRMAISFVTSCTRRLTQRCRAERPSVVCSYHLRDSLFAQATIHIINEALTALAAVNICYLPIQGTIQIKLTAQTVPDAIAILCLGLEIAKIVVRRVRALSFAQIIVAMLPWHAWSSVFFVFTVLGTVVGKHIINVVSTVFWPLCDQPLSLLGASK